MNTIKSAGRFRSLVLLALGLPLVCSILISGCAGHREVPPGTPDWVREGLGPAIVEGTRYLYGIGVVGKMKSRVLMRAAADNKAKNKLSRAVDDYVDALMAAYGKSAQAGGDAETLTQTHQDLRAVVGALLPSAVIGGHWQDPETGNYFSLCRLTFSMLLERIAMARILPESLQRFTLKEGPLLFDRQNLAPDV
jgi:hypothetical protein